MQRTISTAIVIGGAALVVAWLVSPAASAPTPIVRDAATIFDELAPELEAVNQQVDRLNQRQKDVSNYPPPVRDPFSFGRAPDRARPVPPPAPVAVSVPAPSLPRLVAILTTSGEESPQRSAVFADGDDVRIVRAGDTSGALAVDAIAEDAVTLLDRATGTTYRVSLR